MRPFEVFVNGVLQREGADYVVRDGNLLFERPMKEEGKLGLIRWASITLGIAGSYRQNDSVDVAYERERAEGRGGQAAARAGGVSRGSSPLARLTRARARARLKPIASR